MKISLPNCGLGVSLEDRQVAWCIVSSICFLVGLLGIFLLKNHFGLLPILVLGIASILIGGRVSALLNWSNNREDTPLQRKTCPESRQGGIIGLEKQLSDALLLAPLKPEPLRP
jgi:hypothetical protein